MKNLTDLLTPAELKALRITSTFETGKPLDFGCVSGNFDNQGLSFGILQWNIKSGALQPLLKEYISLAPAKFVERFGNHAVSFRDLLFNQSLKEQMQFALSINDSRNHIIEPWKLYFTNLGKDTDLQSIQIRAAKTRLRIAARQMSEFGFHTERAFAFLFDIVTQHGPNWLKVKKRDKMISAKLRQLNIINDEKASMRIIAEILSATVKPAFAKNVLERRNIIINSRGKLGKRLFNLERDFGLSDEPILLLSGRLTRQPLKLGEATRLQIE